MYIRGKHIHPAAQAVMKDYRAKEQAQSKKTRVIAESEVVVPLLIETELHLDPFDDFIVPINETHAFMLNEDNHYEVIQINEVFGAIKKAWNILVDRKSVV